MKRKRTYRSFSAANPDGNYTPSDSDSDSDGDHYPIERKILKIQSENASDSEQSNEIQNQNASNSRNESANAGDPVNSQLLHAALRKIQELENELAELDEADYDSGHHDEDEADEGHASDFDETSQRIEHHNHDHRNEIINEDAEALGFAFCVKETFDYLAAEGVTNDNPIIAALRERFLDRCDPFSLN